MHMRSGNRLKMEAKWIIILLSTHWTFCAAVNEFYSSTDHMTQLIDIQREFAQCLSGYIEAVESEVDLLKRALNVLESNSGDTKDTERMISNPVAAFQLVRKLQRVWSSTRGVMAAQRSRDTLAKLRSAGGKLPGAADVTGVVMSLLRLQNIYRLDPRNISVFSEMNNNVTLDPDETFHISVVCYQNHRLQEALLWTHETLRKLSEGEEAAVTTDEVLQHLAGHACQLPPGQDPIYMRDQFQAACSKNIIENLKTWDWKAKPLPHYDTDAWSQPMEGSYEALCTGQQVRMTPERERKLVCRYRTGRGKRVYAPFKEEVEWDQPLILRYHDFLSDPEMDTIRTLARPKLSRAQVLDPVTGKKVVAALRVSKSAWLSEDENPLIGQINHRIADVTGLDLETAEELQIANYGIGGQYEPHYDSKFTNDSNFQLNGGRIATVLIYMSEVDVGGATVFPNVGAALQPKRGTAVFWFNLLKNGNEDSDTLHAACPVFVGNKWVANKWIRARGQEFRRKCSTVQSD